MAHLEMSHECVSAYLHNMACALAADACEPEGMMHGLHSKQDEH